MTPTQTATLTSTLTAICALVPLVVGVERAHLHEDLCHDHLHLTEAGRAAAPISTESAERATA